MITHASCLIKTRIFYSGFPEKFQYYSNTMSEENLKKAHTFAIEMMEDPKGIIAGDHLKRCVISDEKYLILGISGFLADILKEKREEYNEFCDLSGTRMVYGFFAFVWNKEADEELPTEFPKIIEFGRMIEDLILPYWKVSDNSVIAERFKQGIANAQDYSIEIGCSNYDMTEGSLAFHIDKNRTAIIYDGNVKKKLDEAVIFARQKEAFSVCIGAEIDSQSSTVFNNWIVQDCNSRIEMIDSHPMIMNQKEEFSEIEEDRKNPEWQDWKNQESVKGEETGYWEKKWIKLEFRICRVPYKFEYECQVFVNMLRNISGIIDVSESEIVLRQGREEKYLLSVEVGINPAINEDDITKEISKEIKAKHEKGYFNWISSNNIKWTGDSDWKQLDWINHLGKKVDSLWMTSENLLKKGYGKLKIGKRNEKIQSDNSEIVEQLEELYGTAVKREKNSNLFKTEESSKNDPFDL